MSKISKFRILLVILLIPFIALWYWVMVNIIYRKYVDYYDD